MSICVKCNKSFSRRIIIEGKERNLQNRKYCLECSPFGIHQRNHLEKYNKKHPSAHIEESLTCVRCNRQYVYKYPNRSGSTRTHCNSCMANRRKCFVKKKIIEYLGGKCFVCGYDKNYANLCVHHKDEKEKLFTVSGSHGRKWEVIQKELNKCILLCSNCHGELHNPEMDKDKFNEQFLKD